MPVTYVHESSPEVIGTQTETSNMYFPTNITTITIKDVIACIQTRRFPTCRASFPGITVQLPDTC